jgi:serine/threonine protein phosphatase 1
MANERTIVIGDIHGCLDMIKRLIDRINWQPGNDRLIFLGDYIDRGENSKGVVDFILALSRCSSGVECLIGNHEALFLDYLNGRDRRIFLSNGGWITVEGYLAEKSEEEEALVPPDHMSFYQSLKSFIELEEYYIVHAGFKPGVHVKDQELNDMIWIRDQFIYTEYDFGKRVIFGHTPFDEPFIMENKIGLDTGAVYGNRLTCLELPEFRFHSVEA